MNVVVAIFAFLLALTAAWLGSLTAGPAFSITMEPMPAGQLRGMIFTVVMSALALGSLWVAFRSLAGGQGRRAS